MKRLAIVMTLVLVLVLDISAHPGRTNADGCHYCRTNCEQYGLQQDEYHCHNNEAASTASSTSTVDSSSSSVKTTSTTSTKKTTSSVKITENIQAFAASTSTIEAIKENVISVEDGVHDYQIEKDIYPKTSINQIAYESSDYKARRAALYMFSLILILVLIKFIIRK